MAQLGLSDDKRYSDLPDEVQVKDAISLDLMSGITLPLSKMRLSYGNADMNIKYALKEIERVLILLDKHNRLVPIYDIDTFARIDDEENVKCLLKERKHKII